MYKIMIINMAKKNIFNFLGNSNYLVIKLLGKNEKEINL